MMHLLRTPAGAGIALLVVFAIVMLAGCTEEPATINWAAGDGLEHYR